MSDQPGCRAAVLIPARNEADSIGRCLDAVLAQDLPLDELEVVVVDGASTDGTAELARSILEGSGVGNWTVFTNPGASDSVEPQRGSCARAVAGGLSSGRAQSDSS